MRDHLPIPIEDFQGLYDRGSDEVCPPDHFRDGQNFIFDQGSVRTRGGLELVYGEANIRRMFVYRRPGEVTRILYLAGTSLYDSLFPSIPILTLASMTDFSAVTMFGRAYISPHNGETGLPGTYVYVYDGSGSARIAGGAAPSGTLVASVSSLSGNIEEGTHLFAIAFETASGFITKPGPLLYATVSVDGTKSVDLSGIPVGPTGTVARHILATKAIPDYDGNQEAHEFFFIADATINNNIDTTATVNFYDANLNTSADYLFEQMTYIPAGVQIGTFKGRMYVLGSDTFPDVVRLSKAGEPESFNELDGLLSIDPNSGTGLRNAVEFRDNFYLFKPLRTYVATDNGSEPSAWEWVIVDKGIGTNVWGVATTNEIQGANLDKFVVASKTGLVANIGFYEKPILSWKVDAIWDRINKSAFNKVQVVNDTVKERIYVTLPLDAETTPGQILVADYQNGFDAKSIRFSIWKFPFAIRCIVMDVQDDSPVLYVGANEGIYKLDETRFNDNGTGIDSIVSFALLSDIGRILHCAGVRLRANGSGNLQLSISSLSRSENLPSLSLSSTRQELVRLANFVDDHVSLTVRTNLFNERFSISRIVYMNKTIWNFRPQ